MAPRLVCSVLSALFLMSSPASASEPEVLFEDTFAKQLDESWILLREDRSAWRINDGALEIHVQPMAQCQRRVERSEGAV